MEEEYILLFVDVQACRNETDAIVKLVLTARDHRAIGHKVYDAFKNVLGTVLDHIGEIGVSELTLKLESGVGPDWRSKADEVLARLASCDKPVVVMFDELPVLVSTIIYGTEQAGTTERIERGRVFLSWLREATIRHRGRLRFVVSGSIGMEPLLSRAGLSATMTTFTPLELGPWDRPTALSFLRERARPLGVTFVDDAENVLLEKLQYFIPHHVAMFMHFVRVDCDRRAAATCSPEDIERIYEHQMLSVHGHVDLATYEERLRSVVGSDSLRAALELLTEASITGRLTPEAALKILAGQGFSRESAMENLRFLLGLFVHDGYLKPTGKDYIFRSHLLRDWWRNRFGFGYLPAQER